MNFQHPARNRTPAIAMRAASRRARVFGQPLVDLAFKDYSAVGKAIEFGINVHQGQEWGLANQIVMLTTCLAIIVASISAVVMWWERRPKGKIGVPPYPADSKVYWSLWVRRRPPDHWHRHHRFDLVRLVGYPHDPAAAASIR